MSTFWLWMGSAIAFFGSLIAQHVFLMQPCSWCIMQRVAAGVALSLLTLTWFLPKGAVSFFKGLAALSWVAGLGAASYQTYEFYLGDLASCGGWLNAKLGFFTMDYPWTAWILEPTAMCATANVLVWGLPVSMWSAIGFLIVLIGYIGWAVLDSKPNYL